MCTCNRKKTVVDSNVDPIPDHIDSLLDTVYAGLKRIISESINLRNISSNTLMTSIWCKKLDDLNNGLHNMHLAAAQAQWKLHDLDLLHKSEKRGEKIKGGGV